MNVLLVLIDSLPVVLFLLFIYCCFMISFFLPCSQTVLVPCVLDARALLTASHAKF